MTKRFESRSERFILPAAAALTVVVALIDFLLPLGYAIFVLYSIPIALTFWTLKPASAPAAAMIASILITVHYFTAPEGTNYQIVGWNRGLGIVTLWVMTAIGYRLINVRVESRLESWLKEGQAQMAECLVGEQELSELGDNVLQMLSSHLGASTGAMYIGAGKGFECCATYGVEKGDVPQSFAPGQGLLGQVVKDEKIFHASDLPPDFLRAKSSLGEVSPREVLIIPIRHNKRVTAVVELGFLGATESTDLMFLDRVEESLGAAVQAVKYRMRLKDYLEETQQQSEEVQAQSEELRVSNEELEEQSRALQESHARMELQHTEMEQINAQLEEQTNFLEKQKQDLLEAKMTLERQAREVEQASRFKSDFLANMSHELRTPLNSSMILAKLLAENRSGNLSEEQVKYAKTIESSGNDLLTLINDVLDLSKIEAGHMEIHPEPIEVEELVEGLRNTFEPVAAKKSLELRMEIEPGVPKSIESDSQRLEQILKNLLSNALKFTENGKVMVRVSPVPGGRVGFVVSDTGIGITPEQQRIIFDPFFQADGTTSRKYGGTGLGLSISRNLTRLLGGEIQLSSEAGRGSAFTVVVPVTYEGGAEEEIKISDTPQEAPITETEEREPEVVEMGSVPDDREVLIESDRVILTVEDDITFAKIVYDLAREMSFKCLIATTAEEALILASDHLPNAVVLDVGLPDNSGLIVLERLKGDPRTRHIPVHVVSGSDYTQTALALGAVGYMLKPVKREQLVEAFRKLETRFTQTLRRVLVVEDDFAQQEAMRGLLGSRDVETVCVETAADCLEQLRTTTFDCMVLDLSLPDATGFSLLETLSEGDTYSFPPVIVYTGRELRSEEEQRLRKYSKSIIIKGAKSHERLLDEVSLFLHQVVSELPPEKQQMLEKAGNRDSALEGRRILVVEDDVRNIFALSSLLEGRGVQLKIARNGRESLEMLEKSDAEPEGKVDLVLMDIMMPEMDGLTAMREIRKQAKWKKLPIIALTAKAMKSDQEECISAGANDYLAKPLDVDKLLSLIRVWMPR
ncbi:response regulator [Haloferula chungangensis]|uniref:histidine kinase n=1 Tax=Haloferula chungangensis TaxID=1048331 RepID=A0ABW2L270_9BACT